MANFFLFVRKKMTKRMGRKIAISISIASILFLEKSELKEDFSIFGRIPILRVKLEKGENRGTPIGGFKSVEKMSRMMWERTRDEKSRLSFIFFEKIKDIKKTKITIKIECV